MYIVAKHAGYQLLFDFFTPYFLDGKIHRLLVIFANFVLSKPTQAFFTVSPCCWTPSKEKFSRLSPTTEGVFDPTWKMNQFNSYSNQSWSQFYEHRIRNPKKSPHIFHALHTFWWQHLDGNGTHWSSGYCCCSGCDRLVILVPHIILVHEVISITIKEIKFRYSDSKWIYLFTTRSSRSS